MVDYISLIQQNPRISIILISLAITFLITLVNYFFMDKEKMKGIKARQKEIQQKMKEHQKNGNTDKMKELQKELFSSTGEMMKGSLKPMLITIIPILVLFGFVRTIFTDTIIAKTWFWYYLVSALAGSIIFRKILRLP